MPVVTQMQWCGPGPGPGGMTDFYVLISGLCYHVVTTILMLCAALTLRWQFSTGRGARRVPVPLAQMPGAGGSSPWGFDFRDSEDSE